MAAFKEPKKFNVVPGNAADVTAIQDAASVLNPSMTDLFPAIYQLALAAGGKAPERTTFNEFLRLILQRLYFIERGGVWSYDATADYPAGAVVGYSGSLYLALGDNGPGTDAGAVQPDTDSTVWQRLETAADLAKVLLGYLPVATAESDYLKKSDASDTYLSKTDGAEAHNAMWGGRDITDAFDAGTVSTNIANGTFRDIFPGDYITKQVIIPRAFASDGVTVIFEGGTYTVNWVVADCDYWINKGDTAMTAHHVAIVPQAPIFDAQMNSTNTTEGGYAGSRMYRKIIPACAAGIVNAFGSSHILTFRDCATNNMNASATSPGLSGWFTGVAQGVAWADMRCNLMSEGMVYGNSIWSSSGDDNCIGLRQMSAFRLSERLINYNRQAYWLRNIVSSAYFALVGGDGRARAGDASGVLGVRPFALLR